MYTDRESFKQKLIGMKQDGFENLHILADFDNTLTKAFIGGKKAPSLVSTVRWENWLLWEECMRKDKELFEYYYPKETDPYLDIEQKKKYMLEWWEKSFDLFIQYGLSKDILEKIGKMDLVTLREGVKHFLGFTNIQKVPIVIISASGLWIEPIENIFKSNDVWYSNIKVVSNQYIWDKYWNAVAYKSPLIHSFNKDITILEDFPEVHSAIKNRKNVILLWDSLWDHHMVDGFAYEHLIKIGF